MRKYVPDFIESAYRAGRLQGSFAGSVLIVDISGFTGLMEAAFALGDRGAEVLSQELRRVFDPPVAAVISRGGIISTFAGDAFTALFPGDETGKTALAVAREIRNSFAREGRREVLEGTFPFQAKGGIDRGLVEWGICPAGGRRHVYYFRGAPVDGAASLEQEAPPGRFPAAWQEEEDGAEAPVDAAGGRPEGLENRPETLAAFVPEDVLLLGERPEIRPVVSLFLGFEGGVAGHAEVCAVVEATTATLGIGTLDKLDFGDKGMTILCHFGAPRAVERPVAAALTFAHDLIGRLARDLPAARARAGVAAGPAYSGITGGRLRNEWTCLGEGVNLSARLMTGAAWGEVLVGGRARQDALGLFALDELGERDVRGRRRRTRVARVLGPERRWAVRGYKHALVGREGELRWLHQLLAPALEGRFAGVAYVRGEAGVGKTRLVHEFRKTVAGSTGETGEGVRWIRLPCLERRPDLHPIRLWMEETLGVDPFTPARQKRARVEAFVENAGRPLREEACEDLRARSSFLAAIVDCDWEGSRFQAVTDPRLRYENQLWTVKDLVKALAAASPVVVEVEDAHWLDHSTADWLRLLTRNVAEVPLFLLLTTRPDDSGGPVRVDLDDDVAVHELEIGPLDADQAGDMFLGLTGKYAAAGLLDFLMETTRGNPFFLEQLALHFAEEGLLREEGLSAVLAGEELARLPRTLETALLARFDRLEAGLREGLKHAATLGVRFLGRVLLDLLGRSEQFGGRAETVLDGAERAGIVEEAAGPAGESTEAISGEDAYLFRHVLMQKAAYDLQPPSVRAYVHGLAAEVIEGHFPDRGEFYGELAEHCGRAGLRDKEVGYLEKSAARAADRFLNAEAISLYRRLLDRLDRTSETDPPRAAKALFGLGKVLRLVGHGDEAARAFREALVGAEALDDSDLVIQARCQLGQVCGTLGDVDEALTLLRSAVDLAEETGNRARLGHAACDLGNVYFFQMSEYQRAKECFERLLQVSEDLGDEEGRARAIGSLGNVYDCLGDRDRAMDCFQQRLAISRETGNRHGQAAAIGSIGLILFNLGEHARAAECQREFLALSEELGDKNYQAVALGNLGRALLAQDEPGRAMECFQRYLAVAEELGDPHGRAHATGMIGSVHHEKGEYEAALHCYAEELELARSISARSTEAEALQGRGLALLLSGRPDEALPELRAALALYEELGLEASVAEVLLQLAQVHAGLAEEEGSPAEHREAAREATSRARSLAEKLKMEKLLQEIHEVEASIE